MQRDPELITNDFLRWFEKYVIDNLEYPPDITPNDIADSGSKDRFALSVRYSDSMAVIEPFSFLPNVSWYEPLKLVVTYHVCAHDQSFFFNVTTEMLANKDSEFCIRICGIDDEEIGHNKSFRNWFTIAKLST